MDAVRSDLRNVVVKKDGEQKLWTEQNGSLSWGKPRPEVKGHISKGGGGGGGGGISILWHLVMLSYFQHVCHTAYI
jgi:hypothetical protein